MKSKKARILLLTLLVGLLAVGVFILAGRRGAQPPAADVHLTLPPPPGATSAPLTATLSEIVGVVLVKQPGQDRFYGVAPGVVLQLGSEVKTETQSRARLDLSNGSIIRLGEKTLFVLQDEVQTGSGLVYRLNLAAGKLWIILTGGQLEVKTPSGVASVRGSYMSVEYDPITQSASITCLEGFCTLRNASGLVQLMAGETAVILNASDPPITGWMDDQMVNEWLQNNPEATLVLQPMNATRQAMPGWIPETLTPEFTPTPRDTPQNQNTPVVPTLAQPTPEGSPTPLWIPFNPPPPQPPPEGPEALPTPLPTSVPPVPTLAVSCANVTEIPVLECQALEKLYDETLGAGWTNSTNWKGSNTPCSWYGVTCGAGHVTGLALNSNLLTGVLPSIISSLTSLTSLNLGSNKLSGSFPSTFGDLVSLQFLNLENNTLGSSLPASVTNLTSLTTCSLGYNMLYSSDASVITFTDARCPNWRYTQTLPPTLVTATYIHHGEMKLDWLPTLYTADGGYYEVCGSDTPGTYTTCYIQTADKSANTISITGFTTGTYYFAMRTFTPAHGAQQNDLLSGFSNETSATHPP